ncbi:MAG: hypothetical protein K2R93_12060 [Gemmatimonadaceae bacterium]|nr:hypothetical protein [Gemmatimonadaceae bacterium]
MATSAAGVFVVPGATRAADLAEPRWRERALNECMFMNISTSMPPRVSRADNVITVFVQSEHR